MRHPDWHLNAACRGHSDPDLWFPSTGQLARAEQAVMICRGCPVLAQCRDWVDAHDPPFGVWAATMQRERDERRGKTGTTRIDQWVSDALAMSCGTAPGYDRHIRRDEPPCRPCKDAKNRRDSARVGA